MNIKEFDKHRVFLINYALEYGIIFRVTRKTCSIEILDKTTSLNKCNEKI